MQWRARTALSRAKVRANNSFFIIIIFFIIPTESLRHGGPTQPKRPQYENLQNSTGMKKPSQLFNAKRAPPVLVARDAVWQPVAGTKFLFFVYSAWVERRTGAAAIRVIGATKTRHADTVICRLFMPNNRTFRLKARIETINENGDLLYSAVYVLCLLPVSGVKPQGTVGASLAVIALSARRKRSTNMLLVMDTEPKPGIERTLHVCVKPFHNKYDRDEWVVEWIELHKLLGVSHFYMYNKSLSDRMSCVLNYYQKQGLLTVLSWNLPIKSYKQIRTEGLFAAFNDCLYRSMANAAWLMPVDVDEAVIPRRSYSLVTMLDLLTAGHTGLTKPVEFVFKNVFFYLAWEDDPEAPAALLTLRKTRRTVKPHAYNTRSKYVVRPRGVVELGNHFVWKHLPGATSVGVPEEDALLHHYRVSCESYRECTKYPSTVDRTIHKWSNELSQKVQTKLKKINTVCRSIRLK